MANLNRRICHHTPVVCDLIEINVPRCEALSHLLKIPHFLLAAAAGWKGRCSGPPKPTANVLGYGRFPMRLLSSNRALARGADRAYPPTLIPGLPRKKGIKTPCSPNEIILEGAMDKLVARLNIEHYQKKLAEELDDAKRKTILRLLAEEEAKLAALNEAHKTRNRSI